MSNNLDQFGIYAGKILEVLSMEFPVPCYLNNDGIIEEYLKFDKDDEIKELRHNKDIADLIVTFGVHDKEYIEFARNKHLELSADIDEMEEEKRKDHQRQVSILNGSLEFLIEEGLIREIDSGGLQLTSRAFVHLNKKLEEGGVKTSETLLSRLKRIFSSSAGVSKEVAVGVAINVVTALVSS